MKKLFTLVSAMLLVCLLCVPAFAEWEVNEDTSVIKYLKPNGEYATAEWMDIDGKQYYFSVSYTHLTLPTKLEV